MSEHYDIPMRLRRLRAQPWMRELVSETRLHPSDFVWPVFVQEGIKLRTPIEGVAGIERFSIDVLIEEAKAAYALGIPAIALFPVVDAALKNTEASTAFDEQNLVCRAIAAVKSAVPEMGIIADVALDPYTSHGHDGVLDATGDVDNDRTVALLVRQACVLAHAGADIVAPSDMMDGRVAAIRSGLDAQGFTAVSILSYAAKYASAFYGPFRAAVGSQSALGKADKRSYQMDPANRREALREVALDVVEGADMVMVKPGLLYLDVLAEVAVQSDVPVAVYHVSGEYAMLKAAAAQGLLDEQAALYETMIAFKRAGATFILTYAAREMAQAVQRTV